MDKREFSESANLSIDHSEKRENQPPSETTYEYCIDFIKDYEPLR